MMGFLVLTVEKGRYADIPAILDYFIKKAKEAEGIGTATVTSAVELTEKGREVIEARLLELTNYKSFETTYVVDESLIGGLVIRIGDRVVDSSIKTKLQNMKKNLTKIQLS
jgi:F-type H+-transporting ATPase subunit delta